MELIMIISNEGYADDIMDLARENGAKGGTIIQGRGTASEETSKFFGIAFQPEKDILLIIVSKMITNSILSKINEVYGENKEVNLISFVLPITKSLGIKI